MLFLFIFSSTFDYFDAAIARFSFSSIIIIIIMIIIINNNNNNNNLNNCH